MISYENQNGRKNARGVRLWGVDVRLDGNIVGQIVPASGGYRYMPKGRGNRVGLTYPTLVEVKATLEEK